MPVALVTGAQGALGSAVTGVFRGAGFRVAAVARRWKESTPAPDFLAIDADVTTRAGAEFSAQRAMAAFGHIDALLHLVGGFEGGQPLQHTPEETWTRMLQVNLHSSVMMMTAVIPLLKQRGCGRIVMIGSRAAIEPPAGLSAYVASKAALLGVVKVAAAELRPAGITVNAVVPSTLDTPANREAMGESTASQWVQPASLASLLLWLCSDAGRDITGAWIPVYGRM